MTFQVIRFEMHDGDMIVLSPSWLGKVVVGRLLSPEFSTAFSGRSRLSPDDFRHSFATEPVDEFLQTLCSLEICSKEEIGELGFVYEFPSLAGSIDESGFSPVDDSLDFVFGGSRFVAPEETFCQLAHVFPRIQVLLSHLANSKKPDALVVHWTLGSRFRFKNHELLVLSSDGEFVEVRCRGPLKERTDLYNFYEEVCQQVADTLSRRCPGIGLRRNFLSPADLRDGHQEVQTYTSRDILSAQLNNSMTVTRQASCDEPSTEFPVLESLLHEHLCDVVTFGSYEALSQLTPGIRLHVTALPLHCRRRLSRLLDPPDLTGHDWCMLGVLLGLSNDMPSLGDMESPTSGCLSLWSCHHDATVSKLVETLRQLGRQDAVDALLSMTPSYIHSTPVYRKESCSTPSFDSDQTTSSSSISR